MSGVRETVTFKRKRLILCCCQDEPPSNLTDCVLKHLVISHEYDVYSSYSHPSRASSAHCRRSTTNQHVSSSRRADRRCRRRWYLGVNRRGRVRTVKTFRRPPPMKAFFYKFWHRRRTQPTQRPPIVGRLPITNPFATTAAPPPTTAGGRRARKKGRRKWSRPAFPLLSYGRRRNRSRPTVLTGDSGAAESGVDDVECGSNLLSSCGRRWNSSEHWPTTAVRKGRHRSRATQRRGGRPRSVLMRSPV